MQALSANTVAVLGIPFDANSSFLRGPALAPARIREALHSGAMNFSTEDGVDLNALRTRWIDVGDVDIPDAPAAFNAIESTATQIINQDARLLSIGGDHSVTFPLLKAHAAKYPDITILHIDAHSDLYDDLDGNHHSHASPFARIMENGLATRLIQVGIRTLNPHQREQAERFGVEIISARDFSADMDIDLTGPLYLSLDLDALDPAFAPGVSHHEPGGLSVRDVLNLIQNINVPLIGADIVEYNPIRDLNGMTAAVAVKFMKEILGNML